MNRLLFGDNFKWLRLARIFLPSRPFFVY